MKDFIIGALFLAPGLVVGYLFRDIVPLPIWVTVTFVGPSAWVLFLFLALVAYAIISGVGVAVRSASVAAGKLKK